MLSTWRNATRTVATTSRTITTYPFSKTVLTPPTVPEKPSLDALRRGKGLMEHIRKTLPTLEKQELLYKLFSKQSPERLRPGSIINVTLEHAPNTFTGVLLGIRRRGPDSSFLLRNIVQRTGVEMQIFPNSPHVKEVKVLQQPPKGRMRRAKLFYLRDSPEKMSMIAGGRK